MLHLIHKWKVTKSGDRDGHGTIIKCAVCGKRKKLDVHVLGHNPYKEVRTWAVLPKKG